MENNSFSEIAQALRDHNTFIIMSHVRPDGDAIGSQLALGHALEEMGKTVYYVNEDGLPENLDFLPHADRIVQPKGEVLDVEVAIAVDCATKPRLGENALKAASKAKLWINIDHHISNPRYGDLNHIDSTSPATGQILYNLITKEDLPLSAVTRDAIYVAVSTDTGSFQYSGTTVETYEMAADLVRRGLDVGKINALTYDSNPYRRVELLRHLLNTLVRTDDGEIADWQLEYHVKEELELKPEDSEGLIDIIRAVKGVTVAVFFEELKGGTVRVSMRSKDLKVNVCEVAKEFHGGGHALAAGIRMEGPMSEAREKVLAALREKVDQAKG
ncbi:bifunctional oligoribonuclease and PAP phosphatase NrnA [Rubritalea halochordaticola]|uniref:Bifunctional oligoribonuclease and PAP phosphatase NrnA n=1 Tax=Rubritalea halochordaticola TaxID=714537 RepID=A0ABP9UVT9_9BACT